MKLADAMIVLGGACLGLAGFLFALIMVGVLLIVDKPTDPDQYFVEVGVAWGMLLGGVAVAVLGGWLVRRGLKTTRPKSQG